MFGPESPYYIKILHYSIICSTVLMSILTLVPLMGATWILGLFFVIDSESEVLAWMFTVLNSLQVTFV